MGEDPYL
jgi:hypothetical protein